MLSIQAKIFPCNAPSLQHEKTWVGNVSWLPRIGCSAFDLKMVGVARAVAEQFWRRAEVYPEMLIDQPELMSESDWLLCGCSPGMPDELTLTATAEVARMLNPESGFVWREVCLIARQLIVASRAPGGRAGG